MSLQPLITPLMDFSVVGVSVPEAAMQNDRVFIALIQYEHRGNTFDATLQFAIEGGALHLCTQGQGVSLPIGQLLGSLLAKINGGAPHGAQTH
jgi:hypothetical protein